MKKIIGFSFLFVALFAALFWWGYTHQPAQAFSPQGTSLTASVLVASSTVYDFGTISMKDGPVSHNFTVTNPTEQDVFLSSLETSCMCTTAYLETPTGEKGPFGMEGMGYVPPANENIGAGDSRTVKVVFDPAAHGPAGVGVIDRIVYLTDASGATFQFEIKAVVTP